MQRSYDSLFRSRIQVSKCYGLCTWDKGGTGVLFHTWNFTRMNIKEHWKSLHPECNPQEHLFYSYQQRKVFLCKLVAMWFKVVTLMVILDLMTLYNTNRDKGLEKNFNVLSPTQISIQVVIVPLCPLKITECKKP